MKGIPVNETVVVVNDRLLVTKLCIYHCINNLPRARNPMEQWCYDATGILGHPKP